MYNRLNGVQFPTELLFLKRTFYISEELFLIEVNRPIYLLFIFKYLLDCVTFKFKYTHFIGHILKL